MRNKTCLVCQIGAAAQVCALDEAHYLQTGLTHSAAGVMMLLYDEKSPLVRYTQLHGNDERLCPIYRGVVIEKMVHQPLSLAVLVLRRMARQFDGWEVTEQADARCSTGPCARTSASLAVMLNFWRPTQFVYPLVLLACVVLLAMHKAARSPLAVFFVLAGLGHAVGIAINNPVLAMRYMAIHKMFIVLSLLFAVQSKLKEKSEQTLLARD